MDRQRQKQQRNANDAEGAKVGRAIFSQRRASLQIRTDEVDELYAEVGGKGLGAASEQVKTDVVLEDLRH